MAYALPSRIMDYGLSVLSVSSSTAELFILGQIFYGYNLRKAILASSALSTQPVPHSPKQSSQLIEITNELLIHNN